MKLKDLNKAIDYTDNKRREFEQKNFKFLEQREKINQKYLKLVNKHFKNVKERIYSIFYPEEYKFILYVNRAESNNKIKDYFIEYETTDFKIILDCYYNEDKYKLTKNKIKQLEKYAKQHQTLVVNFIKEKGL